MRTATPISDEELARISVIVSGDLTKYVPALIARIGAAEMRASRAEALSAELNNAGMRAEIRIEELEAILKEYRCCGGLDGLHHEDCPNDR